MLSRRAATGGGRAVQVTLIVRCGRGIGLLALLLAVAGCAGAGGGGGGGGSGGGGQCNDGSWCGDRFDRDHDNQISEGEWNSAFQAADTNGDGQLSQSEFQGAGGNWGGGRGGGR